jgi:outer membrane lipoprotein-sorting protein
MDGKFPLSRRVRTAEEASMKSMRMRTAAGIVLAAALFAPAARARQTPPAASAKEALAVVDKMIAAMGGRKTLASIQDTTISGTAEIIQFGVTVPVTIYQKEPDKLRVDLVIAEAGMTIVQAYDGRKGWMTSPQSGAIEEMPDFMVREIARQAGANRALLEPRKLDVAYALKPKAIVEGRDFIVLEQTLRDGHKTTFYLDPATYLPYKTQTRNVDAGGAEVDSESYTTDYRKVGGVMVPYAVRVVQNGADAQRITVADVAFNTGLEDDVFTLK